MSNHCTKLLLAALVVAASSSAHAAPVAYNGFPAPGGTTAAFSGNTGTAGGRTWTLSGFNPTAYGDLYYTVGDIVSSTFLPGAMSLTMDGTRDAMSFQAGLSDLLHGKAVFTGSTVFTTYNYGSSPVNTRFTLTVTDLSGTPLSLTDAALINGLPVAAGAALHVTGAFKANWLYEADGPSPTGYQPALEMFDSGEYQTSPAYSLQRSVAGAFYSTSPVPEPESLVMMLAGLTLVGVTTRRRANSASPR